jgi:hypothetical protein
VVKDEDSKEIIPPSISTACSTDTERSNSRKLRDASSGLAAYSALFLLFSASFSQSVLEEISMKLCSEPSIKYPPYSVA